MFSYIHAWPPICFGIYHKPLEWILQKNLAAAPVYLQQMMLHLQTYDFDLTYCPGCEMVLADALSHYHLQPAPKIELNIMINHVWLSTECKTSMLNATATDPELSALVQMITDGWPEHIKDAPCNLQKYHSSASILTAEDGLTLYGEDLLILTSEHDDIYWCLHEGHKGYVKTLLHAKSVIFWPGLGNIVEHLFAACST